MGESIPSARSVTGKTETTRTHGWTVHARSDRGLVRSANQDIFVVEVVPDGVVLAVFDGVGGVPRGGEAAQAAAEAVRGLAPTTEGPLTRLLYDINPAVIKSGGATTAVLMACKSDGHGRVAWVGDSSAYLASGRTLRRVTVPDRLGAGILTDHLGHLALRGHEAEVHVPRGGAVLLCTDGVDGILPPKDVNTLLGGIVTTPLHAPERIDALFARLREHGAPDNATIVVAIRGNMPCEGTLS